MYALIFLGLCYVVLTVRILFLRKKQPIAFTFVDAWVFAIWITASTYAFIFFVLFLGAIE